MLQKLDQLLAKEIISLTFIITAAVSSIMMMSQLPRYMEFIFQAPDVFTTFLMLLLFIFPTILKFAVPVSLLLSCAIVIMRMSSDRELEVWLTNGVSIFRLSLMPSLLGVAVALISLFSALFFEPYSNQQFEKFKWFQTRALLEMVLKGSLKEKVFVYDFPLPEKMKFAIYSDQISNSGSKLSDVFLAMGQANQVYSSVIVAESGRLNKVVSNGYPDYVFSLFNGKSYAYQGEKKLNTNLDFEPLPEWSVTSFEQMDLSLVSAFKDKFKLQSKTDGQGEVLYPAEYFQMLEKKKRESENWKKDIPIIQKYLFILKQISIPISTLFLPVIGVCLGILDPRKKQFSVYFGIGIVIFILYASISLCQQLALRLIISPYAILFVTPVSLLLLSSVFLYWRYYYPPSSGFIQFIKNTLWKRS
jgi:lipopolysaccharide export LptBFGC system permease protein LptF